MVNAKPAPWFTLPTEDEEVLRSLVEKYGIARVLAVLSRIQMPSDRQAQDNVSLLRTLGPDALGI
jgi:hypothetical protein